MSAHRKSGTAGLEVLTNGEEDVYLSAASSWEVSIKTKLRTFDLPEHPAVYVAKSLAEQGIGSLSITLDYSLKTYDLPLHHDDPFDRLIIAQAMIENMTVLTADRAFRKYEVEVLWCGR